MANGACSTCTRGQLNDFFPQAPNGVAMARRARAICAGCPVLVTCLTDALATGEKVGIRGGTSSRRRRPLGPLFEARTHDFDPACTDEECGWCPAVTQVIVELDAERERDKQGRFAPGVRCNLNGPDARCGYRSTYARGCRCPMCSFAISSLGRRLTEAGEDTGEWWRRYLRVDGGEKSRMLRLARQLATEDLAEVSAA
jgi:WhiB family redox-sensing transcriptional regulator